MRVDGDLVIFAYPPGEHLSTPDPSTQTEEHLPWSRLGGNALADMLVEYGAYAHRMHALTALADMSLGRTGIPPTLLEDLHSTLIDEQRIRERKSELVSQLAELLRR